VIAAIREMGYACSGCGSGATTNVDAGGETPVDESSGTLLGFEATGPLSLRPLGETGDRTGCRSILVVGCGV
jgi:hypothetical protein